MIKNVTEHYLLQINFSGRDDFACLKITSVYIGQKQTINTSLISRFTSPAHLSLCMDSWNWWLSSINIYLLMFSWWISFLRIIQNPIIGHSFICCSSRWLTVLPTTWRRIFLHDAYEKNFIPQWWVPYRKEILVNYLFRVNIYLNSGFSFDEYKFKSNV